jgi:hypothetical protein
VGSEYKEAPLGILQAKMYEEKKTLKERLTSIMKYNKKPKIIILLSVVLLLSIVAGSLVLGAFSGRTSSTDNTENEIENKYEINKNNKYGSSLDIPATSRPTDIDVNGEENEESAPQIDESHIAYSLIYKNKVIRLGDWDTNINIEDIFGTPKEQNIEILGPNSDTFNGSYKKVMKYDNIEFTLFSPKDNGKSFWITEMLVKDNSIKTFDGITIGASLEELKSTYSDLEVFPDGRTDINNCGYVLDRVDRYKLIIFEVKNGKVEEIKLYIEMP